MSKTIQLTHDGISRNPTLVIEFEGKSYAVKHNDVYLYYNEWQAIERHRSSTYKGDFAATDSWRNECRYSWTISQNPAATRFILLCLNKLK